MRFEITYYKETSSGEPRPIARELLKFDTQQQANDHAIARVNRDKRLADVMWATMPLNGNPV